ncbi:hypothetical protein BX600DRAFT_513816 [Xylariales sp. PMI_506]|nr:hypothetical protein BX600DRAFT_513816 [Xylariales sp. PMI_506]
MHSKTVIIALTFGVSCLAAPLAVQSDATNAGVETRNPACTEKRGYGVLAVCESAVKRAPEVASEEPAGLEKRTGYGVVSVGNDDA